MGILWAWEPGMLSELQESSIKVKAWALTPASHWPEEGQEKAKLSGQTEREVYSVWGHFKNVKKTAS